MSDDSLDGFHLVAGEQTAQVIGQTMAVRAKAFEIAEAAANAGRTVKLRCTPQAGREVLGKRDGPGLGRAGAPSTESVSNVMSSRPATQA